MKICYGCKTEKSLEEFNKHANKKHGVQGLCRLCQSHRKKEKKAYLYDFLIRHFKENPCIECGEKNPILLDFDHLRDKNICIATAIKNQCSLEKLQDEVDKCQVLCANCHRMKTARDHNWYMYKKLYGPKEAKITKKSNSNKRRC